MPLHGTSAGDKVQSSGARGLRTTLRQASFDDYEQIAAVLRRNGLSSRSNADWRHLWSGNPAYERVNSNWPIGWVLETSPGIIVGTVGNLPGSYVWNGAPVRTATPFDWAVDTDYRAGSLRLLQTFANQPHAELLMATTVGVTSEPSYLAFQWSKPPVGQWNRSAFWITGHQGLLRAALAKKSPRFGTPITYAISALGSAWDRLAGLSRRRSSASLCIERTAGFDSRFDVFWDKLQRCKPGVLLAVRSREALAWRFQAGASEPWIVTVCDSSGLLAYAVFVRHDNSEIGLTRLRLADFQGLGNDAMVLPHILAWTAEHCRREGIHVFEDPGCVLEARGIAKAPHHRKLAAWTYYYKAKRADLSEALKDAAIWSPSGLDGDMSL